MESYRQHIGFCAVQANQDRNLDESMACWQLKSPRSLSGRSIHLTLVTKLSWSWSWMTYCHPLYAMSVGPQYWYTAISKFVTMKIHSQGHVCGQKVKPICHIWGLEFNPYVCFSFCGNQTTFGWDTGNSIFDLENSRSRSWARANPMVTFEALEFNRYVCILFRGNRTIFGWDIANSIFDLEKSRSRSWPRSNSMVTFES